MRSLGDFFHARAIKPRDPYVGSSLKAHKARRLGCGTDMSNQQDREGKERADHLKNVRQIVLPEQERIKSIRPRIVLAKRSAMVPNAGTILTEVYKTSRGRCRIQKAEKCDSAPDLFGLREASPSFAQKPKKFPKPLQLGGDSPIFPQTACQAH
jgi:hypothetical protein